MPRLNIPLSIAFQFPNNIQPPAYGATALLTQASVAVNAHGQAISQPAHSQVPLVTDDITDELLAALDALATPLGLKIARIEPTE